MRRMWWTGMLAVIVLVGLGCRKDEGAEARAFDANQEVAGGPAISPPDKNLLADQREISRLAKEARATPAPARTGTGTPATGATTGPAGGGPEAGTGGADTPKAALSGYAGAIEKGDKAKGLAYCYFEPADRELVEGMFEMSVTVLGLGKDMDKAYGAGAGGKTSGIGPTPESAARAIIQEAGDKATATDPNDPSGNRENLVKKGGKWLVDVMSDAPKVDHAKLLAAVRNCDKAIGELRTKVGKEGNTADKINEELMGLMMKMMRETGAMGPGPGPGPEANTAMPPSAPPPTAPPPTGVQPPPPTAPPPTGVQPPPPTGPPLTAPPSMPPPTAPPPTGVPTAPPPTGVPTAPPPDRPTAPPPDRPTAPPPT